MKDKLIFLCICVFLVGVGFVTGRFCHQKPPIVDPIVKTDTLFIRDTIRSTEPVYLTKHIIDSVKIPVIRTEEIHDTTFVVLERESLVWKDSLSTIFASGIMPQIDSVFHYRNDRIITIETTIPVKIKPKWCVGLSVGAVTTIHDGRVILTPGVGLGITRSLISW